MSCVRNSISSVPDWLKKKTLLKINYDEFQNEKTKKRKKNYAYFVQSRNFGSLSLSTFFFSFYQFEWRNLLRKKISWQIRRSKHFLNEKINCNNWNSLLLGQIQPPPLPPPPFFKKYRNFFLIIYNIHFTYYFFALSINFNFA